MSVLVTGAAGFIGFHVCRALLARGDQVIGVDNLNDYYDVALKEARLAGLEAEPGFSFALCDIADREALTTAVGPHRDIRGVVHLAAQAGVRYSLDHPFAYLNANLVGHLTVLELCRRLPALEHLVYASSSSVYGGNAKLPFAVADRVDTPVSLYAATKKADELMSYAYSHLYRIPQTGLRFFTVYGPWGRPDMAVFIFTRAMLAGEPIHLFNNGDMRRDFTYIDDTVAGTLAALDHPPTADAETPPHRLYNIGNHRSEELLRLLEVLEGALSVEAERRLEPMQPGDVKDTYADISAAQADLGFKPTTSIDVGVPRFVAWYREHYNL
jgi:UDP-glucuronate 4-epimerase